MPALERNGLLPAAAARIAGVDSSLLSRALSGDRSLPRERLVALADALGMPRGDVLGAAGYKGMPDIDVRNVIPARVSAGSGKQDRLKVVTDPRFLDSALFWWIFSKQPFRSVGVECDLEKAAWRDVPSMIGAYPLAIGFFNKQLLGQRSSGAEAVDVRLWADLCLYKGYALIGRLEKPGTAKGMHILRGIEEAKHYLERIQRRARADGRKPLVVTMGADPEWRLMTPPVAVDFREFEFARYPTADQALQRFRTGEGDCFIGGLPQRLSLQDSPHVEILHFDNNPFLLSINSLFCSPAVLRGRRALLHAAAGLWFETVAQMRESPEYRRAVAAEIIGILDSLGEQHNLQRRFFDDVFGSGGERYEVFSERPGGLVESLLFAMERVFETVGERREAKGSGVQELLGLLRGSLGHLKQRVAAHGPAPLPQRTDETRLE